MAHGGDVILRPQGDEDTAIMTFTPKKLMLQSPPIELSVSRSDWNPVPGGKAVRDGRNSTAMGSRCQNLLIVEFDGVG